MKNIEQITTGSASSVDPCALLLVNEFRATGTKAWLGFPSQAEISQSIAEREERDFQQRQRRAETEKRKYERLMERAREAARRSREV
jgi:hypothetical protein